ncbi:MAG: HupE/UreJ family protein, partial [Reyranellaceae bacterium]
MSNTTSHNTIRAAATLVAALGSAAAFAHPGHQADATFIAGLLHPLSGLDHVLVIVAVSAWAALLPASARGLVAGCLALFVALGAAMPLAPAGRGLEAALALTVMGSGVLLAVGRRLPAYAAGALAGAFAWVHGLAHGT